MSIRIDRFLRRFTILVLAVMWSAVQTYAFVLSIPGPLGGSPPSLTDEATVLYARRAGGAVLRLAEVGHPRDGLPELLDLGFPFVADDGSVIFAGMVADDNRPRWIVFRADMNSTQLRISRIRIPNPNHPSASLILSADPRPAIDEQGDLIFCAQDTDGKEAIFLLSKGELSCLARSAEKTQEGHSLIHIAFGSVRSLGPGEVAFVGWLENHRQAELIASKTAGLRVIAADGEPAVGGGLYRQGFGFPGTAPWRTSFTKRVLAFSARTTAGPGIFVLHGENNLQRVDLSGASCTGSPVSFLSNGSPGLTSDGKLAVLGWCSEVPVIIEVDDGSQGRISFQADSLSNQEGPAAIADPWLLDSGTILFGGSAGGLGSSIYELTTRGTVRPLYKPYGGDPWFTAEAAESKQSAICSPTIAVNRRGDFAYLGR